MRIALWTPDPLHAAYAENAPPFLGRYRDLLARVGIDAVGVPWSATPPAGIDGSLPLLAWGYHLDPAAWSAALDRWAAAGPVVNGTALLRCNTRKTNLAELARAGVPVVPTVYASRADREALAAAARTLGSGDLVVKPQVSAGGHRTFRLRPGEAPPEVVPDAMIQPFLPAVAGDGELSLFHFGGSPAHAVRKVAGPGEFRVQSHLGGTYAPFDPPADVREAALRALAAAPIPPVYARVDLVRGPDGLPLLMELEAIEPDLYLEHAPDGGLAFAEAVRTVLRA